jgi:hypothetical protein
MLGLDAFKGDLSQEAKGDMRKANNGLIKIPGGMTSQLQVLNMINKPFKNHLSQLYNDRFLKGNHALTPSGKLKKPSAIMLEKLRFWLPGGGFPASQLLLN